ncbi:MAG: hypothetical protein RSD49_21010 [Hafnia sp.]
MKEQMNHLLARQDVINTVRDFVSTAEVRARRVKFLPQQAIKRSLRQALIKISRSGECVLSDGTRLYVPQIKHAMCNAKGFVK